jgi:hypothetical protein
LGNDNRTPRVHDDQVLGLIETPFGLVGRMVRGRPIARQFSKHLPLSPSSPAWAATRIRAALEELELVSGPETDPERSAEFITPCLPV